MHNLHGAHNVDTWIKPALVQENQVLAFDIVVHLLHFWVDVARSDQVLAHFQTGVANRGVHPGRDERDNMLVLANQLLECRDVSHI